MPTRTRALEACGRKLIRSIIAWGPALWWSVVLFLLSSVSDPPGAGLPPFAQGLGHFILYSVLGAALAWGQVRSGNRVPTVALLLIGILYGLGDEWHQGFVPQRVPSALDFLADAAGVLTGLLVLQSSRILRRAERAPSARSAS